MKARKRQPANEEVREMPRGERKSWTEEQLERAFGATSEYLAGGTSLKELQGHFRGRTLSTILMAAVRRREQMNESASSETGESNKGEE